MSNDESAFSVSGGDAPLLRYSRQYLFEHLDVEAQGRLLSSRIAIVGCGGLGSVLANTLVRAGVGTVRIIDSDVVELSNLQRQVFFTERDVAAKTPKAVAAARQLSEVNSDVTVEPVVVRLEAGNAESLLTPVDLILDGTDNFEARFLINDVAVKHEVPWVYGGCAGSMGFCLPILPRTRPCLRCLWKEPPPVGLSLTSELAGILAPIVNVVASLQAMEAIKLLTGRTDAVSRRLVQVDLWSGMFVPVDVTPRSDEAMCICCGERRFEYLDA